jgi:uncharacterized membrane protein YedE/YeeE
MKASASLPSAFVTGLCFGVGLILGGMTLPSKVVGFLDVTGDWDPSLAFVMGGALVVHLALYRWILRRPAPLLDVRFHLPTRRDLDPRLFAGAAIFGAGWGLAGYCPGPALVSVAAGSRPLTFVAAMIAGMLLFKLQERLTARTPAPAQVAEPREARATR